MKRAVLLVSLCACDAGLDQRLAILDQPRVLAIVAEPPEGHANDAVTYSALVGSPTGPLLDAPAWAYCSAPKPPTEDNAVSAACVDDPSALAPLGTAATVTAPIPADACLAFGPDTPPGNFRPRDPDATGGYYQPVRADVDDLVAFGLARVTCHLPTAPADVAHDYDTHYAANANPTLLPFALATAPRDTDVPLTAAWPAAAAESYLYYDQDSQTLVTRREAMRVSWYATGGALPVDATAVDEGDAATSATTTWHTPASPGPATLFFVLRDSRGGIATQTVAVDVQ